MSDKLSVFETIGTVVINLSGGPSCGKSLSGLELTACLKRKGYCCELVQELAKTLVFTGDFETLNNQYMVSRKQYDAIKLLHDKGGIDFIITDGPVTHGLYYNLYNPENSSDKEKTEAMIMKLHNSLLTINILISRGSHDYETKGRYQTEDEAKEVDQRLFELYNQYGIVFQSIPFIGNEIQPFVDYVLKCTKEFIDRKQQSVE